MNFRNIDFEPFFCGALSGGLTCSITFPLSVLKAHGQFGSYRSFAKYFVDKKGSFRLAFGRLFIGSRLRCMHATPFTAIQFFTFHNLKGHSYRFTSGHLSETFVSGAISGAIATVVMFPLETLKTRKTYLEVQEKSLRSWPPPYSINRMAQELLREEGVRGLYRGVGGCLVEAIPSFGLTFMAFEFVERSLGKPKKDITFFQHFISGCVASAFSQSFTFPLQNFRKMVQTGYVPVGTADLVRRLPNPNWVDVVRSVVRTSGFIGAWKGSMANLLAHAPYTGLIFASFELFHSLATGQDPPSLPKPAAEVVAAIQKEVNDIRSP